MPGERFVKTQQQASTRRRGNGDAPVVECEQRAVRVKMHGGLGHRSAAPVHSVLDVDSLRRYVLAPCVQRTVA